MPRRSTTINKLAKIARKVRGDLLETDLSPYRRIIDQIKGLEFEAWPAVELGRRSDKLRERAREGVPVAELETEAFALVREASRRALHLDPHDVQMIAGLAMARGRVAELPTGEGKTLAAVFPAYLQALSGQGVHVLTFNDYLARRDAAWMGPAYRLLGLSVGCVQEGQALLEKRAAYAAGVTYATAKEAGFDFLRDQIATACEDRVHRPFQAAIVDEADSILIDEARIPLVIAGLAGRPDFDAGRLAGLVRSLIPGRDYETDDEHRNVFLTDAGAGRAESALGCGGLYEAKNQRLLEALYCALHAQALLRRDVDYIVRNSRIEIVDEFTGRVMDKRHWPDGLQAAVEAKEGLRRRSEGRVYGSITLQHFFKLYPRLAGMTATARSSADEMQEFYDLGVTVVPPHRPSVRVDEPDAVFTHQAAKRRALVREIKRIHAAGRPVLVGTLSVKESEELAADLEAAGIPLQVLNARNDELEAGIVAEAGRLGAVTISTNMAGRGTDIKLGGADEREHEAVVALGGLYVIGTNRHESLRIDRQLRGRAGRQGDPGSSRFFISLEDDLFERYGLVRMLYRRHGLTRRGGEVGTTLLRREIAHAQRIIEGQNFDIRRSLHKFSSLVELQRRVVQDKRDRLLGPDKGPGLWAAQNPELYGQAVARFGPSRLDALERRVFLHHLDRGWSDHLAWVNDTRETIHLVSLGGKTPIQEFQTSATDVFLKMMAGVEKATAEALEDLLSKEGSAEEMEKLRGPSSTWTYLVNEDQFGWGIEMIKGRNIGYGSVAAGVFGPLFILTLAAQRFKKWIRRRYRPELPGENGEGVSTSDGDAE
jgi:preprotein translocase subunit SecA